ncbi:hypothetical protein D3C77_559310 [compost metagenome]
MVYFRRRAVADFSPPLPTMAAPAAVVGEEAALSLGLLVGDVLQALDPDTGDLQ